jgi:CDP-2,3-bis-(O-geranylgeranyl)-sn-glycerol synthase
MSSEPSAFACAIFLVIAFTIAGLAHSAWLRTRLSRRLFIPLDGGLTLRGRRVFGENKTIRGFVSMVPAAAGAFALCIAIARWAFPELGAELWPLATAGYAAVGAWAGLGFMLGELPNSFVKRQLDVAPGQAPSGRFGAAVSFAVDRTDSIIGMLIALSIATPTPAMTWVYALIIGPGIHLAFSILLYRLGVKARPA